MSGCCPTRAIYVAIMVLPAFLLIYVSISLHLDVIETDTQTSNSERLHRDVRRYTQKLARMQLAIADLQNDLENVRLHHEIITKMLNCSSADADCSQLDEVQEDGERGMKYLSCKQIHAVQKTGIVQRSVEYSVRYTGLYGLEEVVLVQENVEPCQQVWNQQACINGVRYQMMREMMMLVQLQHHPGMVHLHGICTDDAQSISYVLAVGEPLNITRIAGLQWNHKIEVLLQVALTLRFLHTSPVGPLHVLPLSPACFSLHRIGNQWLPQLWDTTCLVAMEPKCEQQQDCWVNNTDIGSECVGSVCEGFSHQMSLLQFSKVFILPLLANPPVGVTAQVTELRKRLIHRQVGLDEMLHRLKLLIVGSQTAADTADGVKEKAVDAADEGDDDEVTKSVTSNVVMEETFIWPAGPDEYIFHRVLDSDVQSKFDYYCPRSIVTWGCMLIFQAIEGALSRCTGDPQCQALVFPAGGTRQVSGGIKVTFKTGYEEDFEQVVGSVVYIKEPHGDPDYDLDSERGNANQWLSEEADVKKSLKSCLDMVIKEQKVVRDAREKSLMKDLGYTGLTEDQWKNSVTSGMITGVSDATSSTRSNAGGSMQLFMDSSPVKQSIFIAESGPSTYHLAHLAFYHIDRLLGIYGTSPSVLRTLQPDEVAIVTNMMSSEMLNQFSTLFSLEKTLTGVLTMSPKQQGIALTKLHLLPLENVTSTSRQLSLMQRQELEHLLLLWLTGTPPGVQHLQLFDGRLLHVMATDAFHQGVDNLLPYFYHCQFPRHTIDVLGAVQQTSGHCTLAGQLLYHLYKDGIHPAEMQLHFPSVDMLISLINRATDKLLSIVDLCIAVHGEGNVLY